MAPTTPIRKSGRLPSPLISTSPLPITPAARPRAIHPTNVMVSSSCLVDRCKSEAEDQPYASIAHAEQRVSANRIRPTHFGCGIFTCELEGGIDHVLRFCYWTQLT